MIFFFFVPFMTEVCRFYKLTVKSIYNSKGIPAINYKQLLYTYLLYTPYRKCTVFTKQVQ